MGGPAVEEVGEDDTPMGALSRKWDNPFADEFDDDDVPVKSLIPYGNSTRNTYQFVHGMRRYPFAR